MQEKGVVYCKFSADHWAALVSNEGSAMEPFTLKDGLTIGVGGAAFVLSLVNLYLSNDDRVRTLRAQISDTVGKLLTAEGQARELNAQINDPKTPREDYTRLAAQRQSLNDLRLSIAQLAIYFLNQRRIRNRGLVADAEYAALARALSDNRDIRAKEYWEKAIECAAPGIYKARLLAFYAEFLFRIGEHDQARRLYHDSLELGSQLNDDLRWEVMFNYLKWAKSEASAGHSANAEKCFKNAEDVFNEITTPDLVTRGRDKVLPSESAEIERRLSQARESRLTGAKL
jgi:tetratricopeptide (TPR) repeat protein